MAKLFSNYSDSNMQKVKIVFIVLVLFNATIFSAPPQNDSYQFSVNLKNAKGNKASVELITPKISSDKALYRFPAMVPGTYAVYNFGRYISNFKAFDQNGNPVPFEQTDVNTWSISNASSLYKITYDVKGTFKIQDSNTVFEPAGTNIQPDTNFVVNNHGFFGYFEGYIDNDYVLDFTTPQGFYGATSLDVVSRTSDEEIFGAHGYHVLVDNPIMFCMPDTSSVTVGDANVMVSVYSPGKGIHATDVTTTLKPVLFAIKDYLDGKLLTDKYTFIFYFSKGMESVSGSFGALEHNQSSLYFLPFVPSSSKNFLEREFRSTCAHEFMHTVTPLNLHSEEIGNFDFNKPVMSEHLWFYEGETEYSAYYIQLRQGLITLNNFADNMNEKLRGSARYIDTLPFTELSKGALDKYKDQYENVYEKGALINLCLDVLIRDESNGGQGLKDVIQKLLQKYGKNRSFKDEDLFGDITALTSPKVGEFLERYVAGYESLPYEEVLGKIGLNVESTPYQTISFGRLKMGFDMDTRRMKINEIDVSNPFVQTLGVMPGDEVLSVNGIEPSFFNMRQLFGSAKNPAKVGDDFELEVARPDGNGGFKNVTLHAKVLATKTSRDVKISINESPDERQLMIRNAWLGK